MDRNFFPHYLVPALLIALAWGMIISQDTSGSHGHTILGQWNLTLLACFKATIATNTASEVKSDPRFQIFDPNYVLIYVHVAFML